jgi:hypothetical protein
MNQLYGSTFYTTGVVSNDASLGIELFGERGGTRVLVAQIVCWDANGQVMLQTFHEIPLEIVEELIVEAKQKFKIK